MTTLLKFHETKLRPGRLKNIFHVENGCNREMMTALSSKSLLIFLSLPGMPFTIIFLLEKTPP